MQKNIYLKIQINSSDKITTKSLESELKKYLDQGHLHITASKNQLALTDYKNALRIEPNNMEGHLGAATAYYKLGYHAKALKEFDTVITLAQERMPHAVLYISYLKKTELLRKLGRKAEAVSAGKKTAKLEMVLIRKAEAVIKDAMDKNTATVLTEAEFAAYMNIMRQAENEGFNN